MSKPAVVTTDFALGNSVFVELSRDFRATLKAAKRILGDKHMFTTVCLHACVFPTDRMSLRMVWDQFQALTFPQRADIMQALRNRPM